MMKTLLASALICAAGVALPVFTVSAQAQGSASPAATDSELAGIKQLLTGSWKTTSAVAQTGGESGATAEVVMHIAPVMIDGMRDTMYVEVARADAMHAPYRQAIFQLYRFGSNTIRLRTLEFRNNPGVTPAVVGFWAAPDLFPALTRDDLIATLDIELAKKGAGYAGKTPYAYPTAVGGAVQMTSAIEFDGKTITSIDQGIGADGKVVWGSGEGMKYSFSKFDPKITPQRLDGGLVAIDFVRPEGQTPKEGGKITVHYSGWLLDGKQFDSSRQPGREPFTYDFPGQLIAGWNNGSVGMTKGTIRRLYIPSALGYGERGAGRGLIPPNATLVFELEVLAIQPPADSAAPAGNIEIESAAPGTPPPAGSVPKAQPVESGGAQPR